MSTRFFSLFGVMARQDRVTQGQQNSSLKKLDQIKTFLSANP